MVCDNRTVGERTKMQPNSTTGCSRFKSKTLTVTGLGSDHRHPLFCPCSGRELIHDTYIIYVYVYINVYINTWVWLLQVRVWTCSQTRPHTRLVSIWDWALEISRETVWTMFKIFQIEMIATIDNNSTSALKQKCYDKLMKCGSTIVWSKNKMNTRVYLEHNSSGVHSGYLTYWDMNMEQSYHCWYYSYCKRSTTRNKHET